MDTCQRYFAICICIPLNKTVPNGAILKGKTVKIELCQYFKIAKF